MADNENAGGGNPGANAGGNVDPNAGGNAGANKDLNAGAGGNADPNGGGNADPAKVAGGAGGADPNAGKVGADGKPIVAEKLPDGWTEQNWREKYAGDDATKLNTLKRYATLKDALDASFTARGDLQKLLSSQPPGKDATPEAVKAWRTAQGIPETPEGYLAALPKEVQFGEGDRPGILNYLKAAHERGEKPDAVMQNLRIYKEAETAAINAMVENDGKAKQNLEETLQKEWGGEYKANIDVFNNFMSANFPKEIEPFLMNARGADGSPLMLNVPFVKSMVNMARQLNPMNINTGGVGMDQIGSIEDQIKTYEARMGTRAWFKDEKSQKHYRELVDARDRYKAKAR